MKQVSRPNTVDRATRVLGAALVSAGVSAIATVGISWSAKASTVYFGEDYFETGSGASFTFGGPINQKIDFIGVPIHPATTGSADTIVERKTDCVLPVVGSSCMTNIEMVELSLKNEKPVNYNNFNYDIFVKLDNSMSSTGTLTINHEFPDNGTDVREGTASSNLNVFFEAMFVETGGDGTNDFSVLSSGTFNASGDWSHEPASGSLVGPNSTNFFWNGRVDHTAEGHSHPIIPPVPCQPGKPCPPKSAPEPTTTLGSVMALGFGAFLRRKISQKGKGKKKD